MSNIFTLQKKLNFSTGVQNLQVNFEIKKGSFVTLYGKSGAGKTSILRLLAGLLMPDDGQIIVNGMTWFDKKQKINLAPQQRKVGFLFQDYALFPNMTVKENLEFALAKGQNPATIKELIELIELGNLQNRKPKTLSGGQQQRVALARALVQQPQLLLLDEPLSALDYEMRTKLQTYLLQVHQTYQLTTILVSHDIPEIVKMSDMVFVLEQGKIINQGTPLKVFKESPLVPLQITGTVTSILAEKIVIFTEREMVNIPVTKEKIADFKVGDTVQLSAQLLQPILRKI